MADKVKFFKLTETRQNKLLELSISRHFFKGSSNPEDDAKKELYNMAPKTRKSWRQVTWIFMKSVDKKRQAVGLEPIYDTDKHSKKKEI